MAIAALVVAVIALGVGIWNVIEIKKGDSKYASKDIVIKASRSFYNKE